MKILKYISGLVVISNFVAVVLFSKQRTAEGQLLATATLVGSVIFTLAFCLYGVRFYRRDKFHAISPAVICLIGLPLGFYVGGAWGNHLKAQQFRRNLPRYQELVRLVKKGGIQRDALNYSALVLPPQYADLARRAWAQTNSSGTLFIEFITEFGIPVKHSGYLYSSNGKIEGDSKTIHKWPYRSGICTNWFRISD